MKYNDKNIEFDNSKISINDFFIEKIRELESGRETDIYSIDFTYGSVIFTKKI